MLPYAWRCLNTRPALAAVSSALALVGALPGALVATALAPATLSFLLTGDVAVAVALLPSPLAPPRTSPLAWLLVILAGALACAAWARLFAVAIWVSDDTREAGFITAWRGTRPRWRRVLVLYVEAYALVACLAGLLAITTTVVIQTPLSPIVLVAASLLLGARAVVRVFLTLAVRAVVLEERSVGPAWTRAREIVGTRRRDVAAAWMMLVAIGAVVWMGGRLISPVLQDTALVYPASSGYALVREVAHLLVAIPLEGFVMAMAVGVWTALFLEIPELEEESQRRPTRPLRERSSHPWVIRGFAVVLAVAVIGNAAPTGIDAVWDRAQRDRLAALGRREIRPADALRPNFASPDRSATSYRVRAFLVEDELSWTTNITYRNDTNETLEDVGVHVYPAAYTRPPEEIPLAGDLIAADPTGVLRADTRSGTLEVRSVRVGGEGAPYTRDETALTIELDRPLRPGGAVPIRIALGGRLPTWPDRFGVWEEITLLGNWVPVVAVREDGSWRLDPYEDIGDPFFAETADYVVELTAADDSTVVGTGALTHVREEGSTRVWRFVAPASRDVAFAVGPFRGLQGRIGDTTVRSWYSGDDREQGAAILGSAVSAVAYYQGHFGRLPFDEIEVVSTRGFLGGMEYPGLVFTAGSSGVLEDVPLLPDLLHHAGFDAAAARYVVGHEVAHQWWYASVGNDQIREPWLDEAFAETSARLWLSERSGAEREWRVVNLAADAAPGPVLSKSVSDFGSNAAYSRAVYIAGSEVLLGLKERVGSTSFFEILRTWHERKKLSTGTIEQFLQTVEDVAGADAVRFLERYRGL